MEAGLQGDASEERIARGDWARHTLGASVATSTSVALALVVVGLTASWLLTLLAGGADRVVPHLYYVPILFAAVRFGPLAALGVGLAAGALAGPLSDAVVATAQEPSRWLTRAGFFVGIGLLVAWLVRSSLPRISDELRQHREQRDLRRGLAAGELFLRYQPIVSTRGDRIVGAEALIRWRHPERGELTPAEFLPVAEECDLIHELGRFVLDSACRQAAAWASVARSAGRVPWFVSVNLGGRELAASDLAERVGAELRTCGLEAGNLCLEVTEGVLVGDRASGGDGAGALEQLRLLQGLGVRVAVDDFGTGYSSLDYLRRLPVDVVKVDRGLMVGLHEDTEAAALAGGLVQLFHTLGVVAIAEGVEVAAQGQRIADLQYDYAQGFHYARPMEADELTDLLVTAPTAALPHGATGA